MRTSIRRRALPAALTLAGVWSWGCGDSPVSQSLQPPDDPNVAVPALSLGSLSGEHQSWGEVADAVVDSRGRLYVADAQTSLIRAFAQSGEFEFAFGGRGDGPGEFREIVDLEIGPDDHLYAYDRGQRRATRFAPDGTVVDSWRLGLTSSHGAYISVRSDGALLARIRDASAGGTRSGAIRSAWSNVHDPAEPAFPVDPYDPEELSFVLTTPFGAEWRPFTEMPLADVGADGCLAEMLNTRPAFELRCPGEAPVDVTWTDAPPIPLARDEREIWSAFREQALANPVAPGEEFPIHPIPDTKPFARGLRVFDDGLVWLHRYTDAVPYYWTPSEIDERESAGRPILYLVDRNVWEAYDREGALVRSLTLPQRSALLSVSNGWATATEVGVSGVPMVHAYRLEG